eukprot:TRINITY_DN8171_c0_g2_i1.p1 TRINITY_DN8171_c0_g2~~TRINITY_DN8171_c0_g2_i1.p1  ORF type:complete len:848 (-),score=115.01 TRINITY_DN8171_c0_g2_i1:153-2696(-)
MSSSFALLCFLVFQAVQGEPCSQEGLISAINAGGTRSLSCTESSTVSITQTITFSSDLNLNANGATFNSNLSPDSYWFVDSGTTFQLQNAVVKVPFYTDVGGVLKYDTVVVRDISTGTDFHPAGIYVLGSATFTNCFIYNCTNYYGGMLLSGSAASITLVGTTMTGPPGSEYGIINEAAVLNIFYSTISGYDTGAFFDNVEAEGQFNLYGSLIDGFVDIDPSLVQLDCKYSVGTNLPDTATCVSGGRAAIIGDLTYSGRFGFYSVPDCSPGINMVQPRADTPSTDLTGSVRSQQGAPDAGSRESPKLPCVSLAATSYTVAEDAGSVNVGFKFSSRSIPQITIKSAAIAGTAQSGSDYTVPIPNKSVTFVTSANVTVTLVNDNVPESQESFTYNMTGITNAVFNGPTAATITITDSDVSLTTKPLTTKPLTTKPLTTKLLTTSQLTTKPLTTKPLTTKLLTTSPLTTKPLTTQPLTTKLLTTSPLTTKPLTTQALTTQMLTTKTLTTSPLSTKAMTSSPLTTQPLTTQLLTSSPLTTSVQAMTTSPLTTSPLSTQAVTTSPLTTEADETLTSPLSTQAITLTTQPLTTKPLTSSPLTTSEVTSQAMTTSPLTTLPLSTQAVTTSPLTTEADETLTSPLSTQAITLTTQPLTTKPLTSSPLTTSEVTSQAMTTSPLTTLPLSTQAVTTLPLTTEAGEISGQSTSGGTSDDVTSTSQDVTTQQATTTPVPGDEYCDQVTFETESAYYCRADHSGYYYCVQSPYLSAEFDCPTGTRCNCDVGEECSQGGTVSPCTDDNSNTGAIVGGTLGGAAALGAVAASAFFIKKRSDKKKKAEPGIDLADINIGKTDA